MKRKYTIKAEFDLRCFKCNELIKKDGSDGMAVWGEEDFGEGDAPFTILHKGKCDDRDRYPMSSELIDVFKRVRSKI